MKILVIFTGGTIGSKLNNGWISPAGDSKYILIENFKKRTSWEVEFKTAEPYFILSENLSAKRLNSLIDCVKENLTLDFDGIIVTHGTDTLQYTACALSLALGKIKTPIVLVSSNYPLDDDKANGNDNFEGAVRFIAGTTLSGVFVSYKNTNDFVRIHSGSELLTHSESSDLIFSMTDTIFAEFDGKHITFNDRNADSFKKLPDFKFCDSPGILVISAVPGDSFNYNLEGCNAIILRPYHSGTLNTENTDFKRFCKTANDKNIPIFVTNIPNGATYESSKIYKDLRIIPLVSTTFVSAYIKIWIAISLKEDIKTFFL